MAKYLILNLSLMLLAFNSSASSCHEVLNANGHSLNKGLYVKVLDSVPAKLRSVDLTTNQRNLVQETITNLHDFSSLFEETKSKLFRSHPPSFLPRIRKELKRIGEEFRAFNQNIADELERFLIDPSLAFEDLEIDQNIFNLFLFPDIKKAVAFVKNPNDLQFGLGYFMDTESYITTSNGFNTSVDHFLKPGYRLGKEPDSLALDNVFSVNVVTHHERWGYYPGSFIPVPRDSGPDSLKLSGLPLTQEVLSFLKVYGSTTGQLVINFKRKEYKETFLGRILFLNRGKNFSRVKPRWSEKDNHYTPFLNDEGFPYIGLDKPKKYRILSSGVILAPSVPARSASREEIRDFNNAVGTDLWAAQHYKTKVTEIIISTDEADAVEFVALPTHKEFLTALIELIHNM